MKKWHLIVTLIVMCAVLDYAILSLPILAKALAVLATFVGAIVWYLDFDEKTMNQKIRKLELQELHKQDQAYLASEANWQALNREIDLQIREPPTTSVN